MSSGELILTAAVGLIVFGPSKLPMLARHLGLLITKFNRIKIQVASLWQEQVNELQLRENIKKAEDAEKQYKSLH